MAVALERHDALIAEVVAAHGGTLLKSKLEGDATVSVFARASDGVAAALALRGALDAEAWPDGARPAPPDGGAHRRGVRAGRRLLRTGAQPGRPPPGARG